MVEYTSDVGLLICLVNVGSTAQSVVTCSFYLWNCMLTYLLYAIYCKIFEFSSSLLSQCVKRIIYFFISLE